MPTRGFGGFVSSVKVLVPLVDELEGGRTAVLTAYPPLANVQPGHCAYPKVRGLHVEAEALAEDRAVTIAIFVQVALLLHVHGCLLNKGTYSEVYFKNTEANPVGACVLRLKNPGDFGFAGFWLRGRTSERVKMKGLP